MRFGGRRESGNVEDRRGMGGGAMLIGGGGLGAVAIAVIAMLLGVDPRDALEATGSLQQPSQQATAPGEPRADDDLARFSRQVLASTEDVWNQALPGYLPPVLVLYDGATDAGACGTGQAAMGPFYCPPDQKLYIDLAFYRELSEKFGARGDFAQAYVIAHEVGHHIQKLEGTSERAQAAMRRTGKAEANEISVRVELQADCYAGVWAHHAGQQGLLEPGDIEEGIAAAEAVGDDRLTQGRVSAENFTHGTAQQRSRWFATGLRGGDVGACDTFSGAAV